MWFSYSSLLVLASLNDPFERYDIALAFLRHGGVHKPADLIRCAQLHLSGHMCVDVQCGGRRHMAQHGRERFHVHAVFQGERRKSMPIRYNYDKPENPVNTVV